MGGTRRYSILLIYDGAPMDERHSFIGTALLLRTATMLMTAGLDIYEAEDFSRRKSRR